MLKQQILEDLQKVVSDLGFPATDIVFREGTSRKSASDALLSIPKNHAFGDYTTNIPLQLAKLSPPNAKQSPIDIANKIVKAFKEQDYLEKVEVAGPGFINFYLSTESLMKNIHLVCNYSALVNPKLELGEEKKKIMMEYASFNALKPIHIGHLRNIVLGESVSRLLASSGNEVFRVTYSSDIGLPSAKVVWGILKLESQYKKVKKLGLKEKMDFLGKAYVKGATAYEEEARVEIDGINKKIYQRDPKFVPLWQEILGWTFEYFNTIYEMVGTKFDGEFLESQAEGPGSEVVRNNTGKVFTLDQGAIIFPGEKFGLHNRVFITAAGNPTYEAKDIGLARLQYEKFPFDLIVHVVARDQEEYFKVVFKALEQLEPEIAEKERHLSYGYVNLPGGKMSSRKGNVLTLDWLVEQVKETAGKIMDQSKIAKGIAAEERDQIIDLISIGAVKFSMLKYSPQTDIVFDIDQSVALEGDSGPYVQYTYARAKSVLRSANYDYQPEIKPGRLEEEERVLLHKIEVFPEVVAEAARGLNPTDITGFLLEAAKIFNLFYQKHPIIKSGAKAEFRLALTCAIAVILKQGLYLLGIEAPERM